MQAFMQPWVYNKDKSQLQPSTTIEFLGFIINLKNMIILLPSTKRNKIRSQCQWLLDKTLPTVSEVACSFQVYWYRLLAPSST